VYYAIWAFRLPQRTLGGIFYFVYLCFILFLFCGAGGARDAIRERGEGSGLVKLALLPALAIYLKICLVHPFVWSARALDACRCPKNHPLLSRFPPNSNPPIIPKTPPYVSEARSELWAARGALLAVFVPFRFAFVVFRTRDSDMEVGLCTTHRQFSSREFGSIR
jgi:hypothetical protein